MPLRACSIAVVLPVFATLLHPVATSAQTYPAITFKNDLTIDATQHDLSPIGGLAVSTSGMIAITQPQDFQVKVFSGAGKLVATYGKRGDGPGEFRSIAAVGWVGDTVWVADATGKRVTLFPHPTARPTTYPVSPTAVRMSGSASQSRRVGLPRVVGIGGEPRRATILGSLLAESGQSPVMALGVGSMGDAELRFLAEVPSRCGVAMTVGGMPATAVTPLCQEALWSAQPDGMGTYVVGAEQVAGEGSVSVRYFNINGSQPTRLEVRSEPRAIPAKVADSALTALERRVPNREFATAVRSAVKVPKYYPSWERAIAGRDGVLALQQWTDRGERKWVLFDDAMRATGAVVLPDNYRLAALNRSTMWVLATDGDGLQSVLRLQLGR